MQAQVALFMAYGTLRAIDWREVERFVRANEHRGLILKDGTAIAVEGLDFEYCVLDSARTAYVFCICMERYVEALKQKGDSQ